MGGVTTSPLGTRNREMALDMVREIEVAGDAIEEIPPRPCVTLEEACDKFLLDVVALEFSEPTPSTSIACS
jgi:hypothetical protein